MTERPGGSPRAVRFVDGNGDARLGALDDEGWVTDAGESPPQGFVPSAEGWLTIRQAAGSRHHVDGLRLLPPVVPGKIIAVGLNYRLHADEAQLETPTEPVTFAKYPSSIIGHGDDIVLPPFEPSVDWEAEIAIVIGRSAKNARAEDAPDVVGGYTALNDVSGRVAQLEGPQRQFTRGKSFDTFTPLGPAIADAAETNLDDLELRCTLNGETVQQSSSRNMIFPIGELVRYCSQSMTLAPGDVIATGTPEGVGYGRVPPRYLAPNDIIEVWVEGVGTLRNCCVAG